jgi:NAD+ diphosphatase
MRPHNVFAGPYVDRSAHLRADSSLLTAALADANARIVPIWKMRNLVAMQGTARAVFLEVASFPAAHIDHSKLILLGRFGANYCFALQMETPEPTLGGPDARFEDLRMLAGVLPPDEAGLLAFARAMVWWQSKHQYCGSCGAANHIIRGGHVAACTNPACGAEHFPRTDPAVIVLVHDGERALLGRQASWPPGRYSTIAGFVEPGESLEDAVTREVREETGIEIANISYHSSQPWPFPSSLMVGFIAEATTNVIVLNDQELEDARWFSRADMIAGTPRLPPSPSISYRLLEEWFDAGGGPKLRSLGEGGWD